jgi:hypothetical protein
VYKLKRKMRAKMAATGSGGTKASGRAPGGEGGEEGVASALQLGSPSLGPLVFPRLPSLGQLLQNAVWLLSGVRPAWLLHSAALRRVGLACWAVVDNPRCSCC